MKPSDAPRIELFRTRGTAKFLLGQVWATPKALALLRQHGMSATELLRRHESGDWGEVPAGDARENDVAARSQFRILSSYPIGRSRIWIVTEADRSATTLLLPDEY